jgi:hypothetical protein
MSEQPDSYTIHADGRLTDAVDWLTAHGCKAAPINSMGVLFTQPPGAPVAYAQIGDSLVFDQAALRIGIVGTETGRRTYDA